MVWGRYPEIIALWAVIAVFLRVWRRFPRYTYAELKRTGSSPPPAKEPSFLLSLFSPVAFPALLLAVFAIYRIHAWTAHPGLFNGDSAAIQSLVAGLSNLSAGAIFVPALPPFFCFLVFCLVTCGASVITFHFSWLYSRLWPEAAMQLLGRNPAGFHKELTAEIDPEGRGQASIPELAVIVAFCVVFVLTIPDWIKLVLFALGCLLYYILRGRFLADLRAVRKKAALTREGFDNWRVVETNLRAYGRKAFITWLIFPPLLFYAAWETRIYRFDGSGITRIEAGLREEVPWSAIDRLQISFPIETSSPSSSNPNGERRPSFVANFNRGGSVFVDLGEFGSPLFQRAENIFSILDLAKDLGVDIRCTEPDPNYEELLLNPLPNNIYGNQTRKKLIEWCISYGKKDGI